MNIYLHVEIAARELDSKLLLATLAAARGHNIIISNIDLLKEALFKGVLPPGIFHDKSLVPSIDLNLIYKEMNKRDILITSLDEESGLLDHDYKNFAKNRFSQDTIDKSSAIFCWGTEDEKTLKDLYKKDSKKIFKTGSPRVDLWRSQFSKNWVLPKGAPTRPFLLVSSNLHMVNFNKNFYEWGGFKPFQIKENISYYKNDPILFKNQFNKISEDNLKLSAFVEAIHYLSENNNGYDIVFRPHPLEDINTWKVYLRGLSNVFVLREDSLGPWISHAFAIMHNSCTSAIEASISEKQIVTYIPFKQNYSWGEVANELGHRVQTLEELKYKVNSIFDDRNSEKINKNSLANETLLKKIFIDKNELAANKIINVWEKLAGEKNLKSHNLDKLKILIKKRKFKNLIKKYTSFSNFKNKNMNKKFFSININDVNNKIKTIKKILKINQKIECKLLQDTTVIIKKI